MVDQFVTDITAIITPVVLVGGMLFAAIRWLSSQAEKKAIRVKAEAKETADALQKVLEDTASDVKEYTDKRNNEMLVKISEVDKKVMEMLSDLTVRANLTNGNVALIRTEISDLQDDILTIQDTMPCDGNEVKSTDMRRLRDRRRKNKRRDIERDRVAQSEVELKERIRR